MGHGRLSPRRGLRLDAGKPASPYCRSACREFARWIGRRVRSIELLAYKVLRIGTHHDAAGPIPSGRGASWRAAAQAWVGKNNVPEDVLRSFVVRIDQHTTGFLRKQIRAVPTARALPAFDPFTGPVSPAMAQAWIEGNVALIRSVDEQMLTRIGGLVNQAVREGVNTVELRKQIERQAGMSRRRAALIARDQTGKLAAQVTAARFSSAGIKQYRWRTMQGERVRPGHRALEGELCSFDDPPDTGNGNNNPGEEILCRCYPEPVF